MRLGMLKNGQECPFSFRQAEALRARGRKVGTHRREYEYTLSADAGRAEPARYGLGEKSGDTQAGLGFDFFRHG